MFFISTFIHRIKIANLINSLYNAMNQYKEAIIIDKLSDEVSFFQQKDFYRLWTYLAIFDNNQIIINSVDATLVNAFERNGSDSLDSLCHIFQNKQMRPLCLSIFKKLLISQFSKMNPEQFKKAYSLLAFNKTKQAVTFFIDELAYILSHIHQEPSDDGYLILQYIQQNVDSTNKTLPPNRGVNNYMVRHGYEKTLLLQQNVFKTKDIICQKQIIISDIVHMLASYLDKTFISEFLYKEYKSKF